MHSYCWTVVHDWTSSKKPWQSSKRHRKGVFRIYELPHFSQQWLIVLCEPLRSFQWKDSGHRRVSALFTGSPDVPVRVSKRLIDGSEWRCSCSRHSTEGGLLFQVGFVCNASWGSEGPLRRSWGMLMVLRVHSSPGPIVRWTFIGVGQQVNLYISQGVLGLFCLCLMASRLLCNTTRDRLFGLLLSLQKLNFLAHHRDISHTHTLALSLPSNIHTLIRAGSATTLHAEEKG